MDGILFKKLTSDHIDAYKKIRRECILNYPNNFGTKACELDNYDKKYKDIINHSSSGSFVMGAFDSNKLIGITGFLREGRKKAQHRGELVQVYVDPKYSGKGIGTRLILHTLEEAFQNIEIEQILLSAVRSNDAATRMYEKIGFKIYGIVEQYFKDNNEYWDQIFMTLNRKDFRK